LDNSKTKSGQADDSVQSGSSLIPESQQPYAMALLAICLAAMAWFVLDQRIRQGRLVDIDDAGKIAWEMKVDVNHAKWSELASLPGVGPVLARAIVQDREQNGHFQSLDQLSRVPGIGETKQKQLGEYLLFMVDSQDSELTRPDD